MSATSPEAAVAGFGDNQVELAIFAVRGQEYAVDVTQVREIVRAQDVTALPKAPALIEGVIDLRGAVVPVVDLARALGEDPVEPGPSARIVLIEGDGLVFGLRVGSATEVLAADAGSLEAPPALATQAGYDAVRAVVRRPEARPVMVLSVEHLLEAVFRSGLSAQGDEA